MKKQAKGRSEGPTASSAFPGTFASRGIADGGSGTADVWSERIVETHPGPAAGKSPRVTGMVGEESATDAKGKKTVARKPKLVRDSFTFPAEDHARLGELKQRALKSGREIKKSELLRAGLAALAAMPDATFQAAVDGVERIKTGRPAK